MTISQQTDLETALGAGSGTKGEPPPLRTSELLRRFARDLPEDRVTLGDIVSGLGDRGLGVLIAIFALPNILPSAVPFGNVPTGIPPLIFAVQLMLGVDHLILPNFLARRTVGTHWLKALAPRVASALSWFEALLRPRMAWVTVPRAERFVGAIAILLAAVSTLPIPFGHNLPALGLVLIGLGLIERDGLAIVIGATIGLIGTVLLALVVFGVAHGLSFIIRARHLRFWR
jgi:hypothetical protein